MGKLYILRLPISYSVHVSKIMKIGRHRQSYCKKISGLFFGPACIAEAVTALIVCPMLCIALDRI